MFPSPHIEQATSEHRNTHMHPVDTTMRTDRMGKTIHTDLGRSNSPTGERRPWFRVRRRQR